MSVGERWQKANETIRIECQLMDYGTEKLAVMSISVQKKNFFCQGSFFRKGCFIGRIKGAKRPNQDAVVSNYISLN